MPKILPEEAAEAKPVGARAITGRFFYYIIILTLSCFFMCSLSFMEK